MKKSGRPAHWGPYEFYCAAHNLYGFFGLYANCPVCQGVSPALLAVTRDRMIREGRERVLVAKPVVRLVAPPAKVAPPRVAPPKVAPRPARKVIVQLHPPRVFMQRRETTA